MALPPASSSHPFFLAVTRIASALELVDRAKGINSPELSDVEKTFLVEMLETALAQLQGPRDRAP